MLTIGEFSRLGSVSVRMLRHYDSAGLLCPAVVDPATGYRRYLATQLPDLYRIVALRASGLTLGEIASLAARGSEQARALLRARATKLEREIAQAELGLLVVRSQLAAGRPDAGELVFHAAFPVADDVDRVAAPAELLELPTVQEAACVARRGPAASAYPRAYSDLRRWMEVTGYRHPGGRRNIFLQMGTARPEDELREINLPLERSGSRGPDLTPRQLGGRTPSRTTASWRRGRTT